jgi:hypothetical protein
MDFVYKNVGLKSLIDEQLKIQKKLKIVLENYEFEAMLEFEEIYSNFQKELVLINLTEDTKINSSILNSSQNSKDFNK